MNALVLANFPLAALIFAAMVGIPLWLTFKRPDRAPRYSQAAAVPATAAPATPASTVPASTGPASRTAAPRVSVARQHAAARTAVPGRQHAAATPAARSHPAQRDHVSA